MKAWTVVVGLALLCAGIGLVAAHLATAQEQQYGTIAEYTRINMGGGYSSAGEAQIDDSISQTVEVVPQQGGRFRVTSVKATSQSAGVKEWEQYK